MGVFFVVFFQKVKTEKFNRISLQLSPYLSIKIGVPKFNSFLFTLLLLKYQKSIKANILWLMQLYIKIA